MSVPSPDLGERPFPDPRHLMIAMPCRSEIRSCVFPDLLGCMLQAASYWHRIHGEGALVTYSIHPRAHVVTARNAAAQQALETGASWVLWVDDDMSPPHDLMEVLHRTGCDFVGALAYRREPPHEPCVARFEDQVARFFDPDPTQALVDADLTGFACLLTQRRVIEAVHERTAGRPFQLRADVGEDFFFCVHAREAGFRLKIVPTVVVGHATDLIVGRDQRAPFLAASNPAAQASA